VKEFCPKERIAQLKGFRMLKVNTLCSGHVRYIVWTMFCDVPKIRYCLSTQVTAVSRDTRKICVGSRPGHSQSEGDFVSAVEKRARFSTDRLALRRRLFQFQDGGTSATEPIDDDATVRFFRPFAPCRSSKGNPPPSLRPGNCAGSRLLPPFGRPLPAR